MDTVQPGTWIAEAREPDGSWLPVAGPGPVREVIRAIRRWRADRGHLADETRVRQA